MSCCASQNVVFPTPGVPVTKMLGLDLMQILNRHELQQAFPTCRTSIELMSSTFCLVRTEKQEKLTRLDMEKLKFNEFYGYFIASYAEKQRTTLKRLDASLVFIILYCSHGCLKQNNEFCPLTA